MHVLISGAGVAGPTFAWFLAKTGVRVTLFEKAASILPHGQNVDIQGAARTVVDRMGLTEEFLRNGTKEQGTRLIDPRGRPIAPFPVPKGDYGVSATSQCEILRADLAKLLWKATKDLPGVTYRFDTTVTKILANDDAADNKDGKVTVEASDGNVEDYDLLVAADGQWSNVRKLVFGEGVAEGSAKGRDSKTGEDDGSKVRVVNYDMSVAYWTIPRLPEDDDWWNIYAALPAKLLALRPDPHGTIRAMVSCLPQSDAQKQEWSAVARKGRTAQEALVRKEFARTGWQAERLLAAMPSAPDFYLQLIQQIRMRRWYKNRVVCLGDAGYAPSPITGMGTSMAINGAYVLAGELSKLQPGEHPVKALEAYDTAYRPFVDEFQQVPPVLPTYVHPRTEFQRWLFQRMLAGFSRAVQIPWVLRRIGSVEQEDYKLPSYPVMEAVLHMK